MVQWLVIWWVAACLFAYGARTKGLEMTARTWLEVAQAACIAAALFWFLSDGRGCTNYPADGVGLTPLAGALMAV